MTEATRSSWAQLASAADEGSVSLERGVGARCAKHCDDFIAKLWVIHARANRLGDVKGLGTLPSGLAVARKFSLAAVGGEYSMVQALEDHITEVTAMKEMFLRIEAQYEAADQAAADTIGAIESGL